MSTYDPDRCPRGQQGGTEGHRRVGLVHRIIEGRLCCLDELLALQYDEHRRGVRT